MATAVMTYEDYVALPDDGNRYEVIEGELCVVPAPNRIHQKVMFNIAYELRKCAEKKNLGEVYIAPLDVVLSKSNVLQPDILYISKGRLKILTDAGASAAPDLAVEVLSPSTRRRDEVTKRRLYERFGVEEFWIVDLSQMAIRIHRRQGEKLVLVTELLNEGRVKLTTPLLPGLAIPLTRIFEG
jgi:Uma2 family endonuclease